MVEVRKKRSDNSGIVGYWEQTYLPLQTRHLRPSTSGGYKHIWGWRLKAHFTGRTFADYKTVDGNKLLNRLPNEGKSKRSIQHVRALTSGIFSHACSDRLIDPPVNAWASVKTKVKLPEPEETSE